MFYNLRKKINLALFNAGTKQIRERAKVTRDPGSLLTIVTLLCDTDVNMYLLALSSFCRFVPAREIVVVSDNLSEQSRAVLEQCVAGIRIVPVESVREPGLPEGGCWERLTYILKNVPNSYVMQLDADTLTLRRPDEVIDAIKANQSFSIVANGDSKIMPLPDISAMVASWTQSHVQVKAEQALKDFENAPDRRYVRACAAFTGFAKNSCTVDDLKRFSTEMESKVGKAKWSEWGSEQVASNYLIANTPNARLLPFNKYPFFKPGLGVNEQGVTLYHFIGSHRFKNGYYLARARQLITSL